MKRKYLIIGGVLALLLLGGLFLYFYQRSQTGKIEYQSQKSVISEANVQPTSEVSQEPEQKTEEVKEAPKQEEKGEEPPKGESETKEEAPKGFAVKSRLVGFGHESASGRSINTIVLHSSHGVNGDPYDVDDVIALWKSYGVAPHYMIARDGTVYQLVSDKNIAYHAGDSKMSDGRKNVNDFSIGVEILNTKTDKYTSAQYQAVKDLISHLKKKYGKMEVVGHDDIAPDRKTDPWNFDWDKV